MKVIKTQDMKLITARIHNKIEIDITPDFTRNPDTKGPNLIIIRDSSRYTWNHICVAYYPKYRTQHS